MSERRDTRQSQRAGAEVSASHEALVVTGSSGLIGSAFIRRVGSQYREIGLDRIDPPDPPEETEHIVHCDVASDESVRDAFEQVRRLSQGKIASILHLAAYYDFSGEPSPLYEEVTVRGTERILHSIRNLDVEQLIFTSTMLVHAPCQPGEKIDEEWPIEPAWPYPESKVATEQLIEEMRGDLPVVILRVAGVYDDMCHSIPIAHQIQRLYEDTLTSRVFPGDTSHGQAFLHLDDLVEAMRRAVEARGTLPPWTVLLIGEPETLSYEEMQDLITEALRAEEFDTMEIPKFLAKLGARAQDLIPGSEPFIKPWMIARADDHYTLDIGRANRLLGWKPRYSLRERVPVMVANLLRDPERWYRENGLQE